MVELFRRKLNWTSLSRLEQLALASSILIWTGVVLLGGGLYVAMRNYNLSQRSRVQATAIAAPPAISPTPTATTELFPVGWTTATPTVTPRPTGTPTVTPTRDPTQAEADTDADTVDVSVQPTQDSIQPASAPHQVSGHPTLPPATAPPNRITIPAIDLDSEIVPIGWYIVEQGNDRYSIWQVADYAASWHKTSAYPGHGGNVVLNGHHNIKGEVFRYLVDLEVGDRILLYTENQVYYYAVDQKMILKEKGEPPEIRRQNAAWIAPSAEERLTMVTCWPYTNNTHRLVVVAKPAPPPMSEGLEE